MARKKIGILRNDSHGLVGVARVGFDLPASPTITRRTAANRILRALHERQIPCERLLLSDGPVRRGALFDLAGQRVPFPHETDRRYDMCFVGLVDPSAGAMWGHPAHWAFVPARGAYDEDAAVEFLDTSLPEHPRGLVRLISAEEP
ncbi:MAG TPA: hypothetical protein VH877_17120 [Polyangia bacterium]|jgi:hypothetical protein|nr:hypothetical protein [Polyangia bacterium]